MRKRAFVLLTTLMVAVVLAMLTMALIKMGLVGMSGAGRFKDRTRAREMAMGGLNHVLHILSYNPSATNDIIFQVDDETYCVNFSTHESINNLGSDTPSSDLDPRALSAPPRTADLVVHGIAGVSEVKLHAVVAAGYFFQRAVGADGQVHFDGPLDCSGVASWRSQMPAGGGIFSNYETQSSSDPAISFNSTVNASSLVRFEARPAAAGGGPNIVGLPPALNAQAVTSAVPSESVPTFLVANLVAGKSTAPPFVPGSPPFTSSARSVSGDRYVGGDITIYGDIHLNGGSLYVHGDLTVYGGIKGAGSVYVDGNADFKGGTTSMRTNQTTGAALYASGNINFEGVDAYSWLNGLGNPTIVADANLLKQKLSRLNDIWSVTTNTTLLTAELALINFTSPAWTAPLPIPAGGYRVIPDPGSTGHFSVASQDNPALTLAADIRQDPAAGFQDNPPNPKAVQLVNSLEELAYATRTNYYTLDPAWVTYANPLLGDANYHSDLILTVALPSVNTTTLNFLSLPTANATAFWDDAAQINDNPAIDASGAYGPSSEAIWDPTFAAYNLKAFGSLSADHRLRALGGSPFNLNLAGLSLSQQHLLSQHVASLNTFAQTHDFNMHWLGNSKFQGLVFAQGNITVQGGFQIVGAVMSNGNVTMLDNANLIYDQEYFQQSGSFSPLKTVYIEEL